VRLRTTHWNTARRRRKFVTRFPAEVPVPHVVRIHKYVKGFGQEVPLETGCVHADTCRGKAVICAGMKAPPSNSLVGPTSTAKGLVGVISKSCTYILRQLQTVDNEGQVEEHDFCEAVPHVMQRPHTRCWRRGSVTSLWIPELSRFPTLIPKLPKNSTRCLQPAFAVKKGDMASSVTVGQVNE